MITNFKLPSGVNAVVKEFTGESQRILSNQNKNYSHINKMNDLLHSIVVEIGDLKVVSKEFIENMLAVDRKAVLVMARQLSVDFEESFEFSFKYESEGKSLEQEMQIPIIDGQFPMSPMSQQYDTYEEIEREVEMVLPRCKELIRFRLLDGKGEAIASNTKQSEISSSIVFKMRRTEIWRKTETGGNWILFNPDQFGIRDLGEIRKEIKLREGAVDTEIQISHPITGENVNIDLMSTVNFFYPNGGI
jgi:hypothetical protein